MSFRKIEADRRDANAARIRYLDGWRGLAILGVLCDHFLSAKLINLGRMGVEMFFVLSGMLMAEILFVRGMHLKTFVIRRFSRTYPALAVSVLSIFIFGRVTHFYRIDIWTLIASLTSTYNYFSIYVKRNVFVDNLWSLCIEEHTYLMLMLIALCQRRFRINPMVIILILIVAFTLNGAIQTLVLHRNYYLVYWRTDVRAASILIGSAIYLYFKDREFGKTFPIYCLVLGFLLSFNKVPDEIKYTAGTLAFAAGLITLRQAPGPVLNILSSRALTYIGLISYSIYLWQQPFSKISSHARILALPVIFLIGYASYRFIENPLRAFINRSSSQHS